MSVESLDENPCLACTVGQDCCTRLTGLTITQKEYDRCFALHGDDVEVTRDGAFYTINQTQATKCPNWQNEGCAVYEDRPFECRLFPHNSYARHHTSEKISLRFHEVRSCPLVDDLKMEQEDAQAAVETFAEGAFGDSIEWDIRPESASDRLRREMKHIAFKLQRGFTRLTAGR